VEVQILADHHGRVVVLGERDCSVQRRHQKVIEESPAPGLPALVRSRLHEAAARAATALGYRNAGTAEFLLAADGTFYFLEMNRRLQVEHPVTEAVFGIDLVAWQLRIAAGEALPEGDAFAARGHAIEARIYAEDPAHGFLPSSGTVLALREAEGPGIRVDSALATGTEISPYYDPLLAKVIAHGETREEAIRRLDLALAETVILGLRTNVGFLRRVLAHPDFAGGVLQTDLIDQAEDVLLPEPPPPPAIFLAAAAHALLPGATVQGSPPRGLEQAVASPWTTLPTFRLGEGNAC
jgi:acetyl/propionyl-CoA carboxylase alpha subunit